MRRFSSLNTLIAALFVILLVASPSAAALRDGWVGEVGVVAWLEGDTVKVALANGGRSRVQITLASESLDQRWRPYFQERTILVPARTVVVEAFTLSSSWRGEPLVVRASAWDREAVVEVQTSQIFRPSTYVAEAREEVEVVVDLNFMNQDEQTAYLVVDEYYKGLAQTDTGQIVVRRVEGGWDYSEARRRVERIAPSMVLSLWAPHPLRDVTIISFSVYKVKDDAYWNYYEDEVPGPTILVYGRNMAYQDNTHLNRDWRR